jgi:hypothetical protein
MANTRSGDAAARQIVAERITVGLVPKTIDELQTLQDRTGLSRTDLVNRAITLYAFLDAQTEQGFELLRRRTDGGGELELIRFL